MLIVIVICLNQRIKAEREQLRRQEEASLERGRRLAETRQRLEERELLILERLKLEEEDEEERATELRRRKREESQRETTRYQNNQVVHLLPTDLSAFAGMVV